VSENQLSQGLTISDELPRWGGWIAHIEFSPEGDLLAIASQQGSLVVFDVRRGKVKFHQTFPSYHVYSATWSPDGRYLACATLSQYLLILNRAGRTVSRIKVFSDGESEVKRRDWSQRRERVLKETSPLKTKEPAPLAAWTNGDTPWLEIRGASWSPDGNLLAIGTADGIQVFAAANGKEVQRLWQIGRIVRVSWERHGSRIAASSYDNTVTVIDQSTESTLFRTPCRYTAGLAWSPDGARLAVGNGVEISLLNGATGIVERVLEGHRAPVRALAFSQDGNFLASRSGYGFRNRPTRIDDDRVILWETETWSAVGVIHDPPGGYIYAGLAFSPSAPLLAMSSRQDRRVQLVSYDTGNLPGQLPGLVPVAYKNAKIALLGDTGVGKSGLNLVLTGNQFAATESTHSRRVASLDAMEVISEEGRSEIRERVLWDLAGQPGYRLIHQLHLGDVSVGVIVFDSRSETDPLSGVRYWARALLQAARLRGSMQHQPARILVAARCDRGNLGMGKDRTEQLIEELGAAAFIEASAKDGTGISQLQQSIGEAIDWNFVPSVSSNILFRDIKKFIANARRVGRLLVSGTDLRTDFVNSDREYVERGADFNLDFAACLGRLESLGLVRQFSFGDLVLLQPELLDSYASSILFAAKQEPDGMGSISEQDVRAGRFKIESADRLSDFAAEKLLLLATIEDLLAHEIAFREPAEDGTILVFPSQLTRENPALPDPPGKEFLFHFHGGVANIYATLVVRLAHSGIFTLSDLWRNAVAFSAKGSGKCGIFLTEADEGSGVLTVFFDEAATPSTRIQFSDYVETHLVRKAIPNTVIRERVLSCPNEDCRTSVSEGVIARRIAMGRDWVVCNICDTRISIAVESRRSRDESNIVTQAIDRNAEEHQLIETRLVSASGEMETPGFQSWVGAGKTTLALVFTDVVGSTRLGDEVGDEAMDIIRSSHFQRARQLLARFKGYEIKTIGDSFMVAFRTASQALEFSLELHRDPGHQMLQIRAGIHVGPVLVEEEDAFGSMVNFTNRVESKAKGAEIWASDRAYEDIKTERLQRLATVLWEKHPGCALKGFKGRFRLWSVKPISRPKK
jgi:small GTP-binding protein